MPFYLRTGKRLPRRVTEIAIQFKQAPLALFRDTPVERLPPNWLVICTSSPTRASRCASAPRSRARRCASAAVDMDFHYADHFGTTPSTGYETLLYDCMTGDPTLFQRADMVEAGWRVVQPVLDAWASMPAATSRTTLRAPRGRRRRSGCYNRTDRLAFILRCDGGGQDRLTRIPPLASVAAVTTEAMPPSGAASGFRIERSEAAARRPRPSVSTRDVRRLPGRGAGPDRPPLPLPVHELHRAAGPATRS